ncbi:MAG: hypothetical protein RL429_1133, partial [Bacteroidota bacterium]
MNKLLYTLLLVVAAFTSSGQNAIALILGSVTDSAGNPVSGHSVTVTAAPA